MIQTVDPREAAGLIASGEVDVVDVREPREWATGFIPGSRRVALDEIRAAPERALPRDNVVFVCAKGMRSLSAAKLAERLGLRQLYSLNGGTHRWAKAGLPLATPPTELH